MEIAEKVLETMVQLGKPVSAGEIEQASGLERTAIDKAMAKLKKEDKIVSPIRCKWEPKG